MSEKSPALSIAIPSYNVEKYLDKGLSSFSDERFLDDLEVLIINDGSSDSTEHIAQSFVDRLPSLFTLVNKLNGGHGSAINAGIAHASGKYFRIVDGDDWVNTENLVQLINQLKTIDTDIVVDEKREVDMSTGASKHFPLPETVPTYTSLSFADVCGKQDVESSISIHTLITKTDLLKKHSVRALEHTFYVDYEYITKATCQANTVTFVPLEIYQYLVGNVAQSISDQNYVKRYDQHERVVKELLSFYRSNSFDKAVGTYVFDKVRLLIHTHYNILLIFDEDRTRGRARADEFHAWLNAEYPQFAESTEKRYKQARMLGRLGVNKARLDKLMGRGR